MIDFSSRSRILPKEMVKKEVRPMFPTLCEQNPANAKRTELNALLSTTKEC